MSSLNSVAGIFILALTTVQSVLYRFIPEHPDLFRDCSDRQGFGGMSDFVDLSAFEISFDDEGLHAKGTVVILWDVEQTDRVSVDFELKKYSRGNWQLTPITLAAFDFCKRMRDTTSTTYTVWTTHIITKNNEEIPCFGKGVKFHHEQFAAKMEYNIIGMNMEGRYKQVLIFQAFDRKNRAKSKSICVEIPGEIIQV